MPVAVCGAMSANVTGRIYISWTSVERLLLAMLLALESRLVEYLNDNSLLDMLLAFGMTFG